MAELLTPFYNLHVCRFGIPGSDGGKFDWVQVFTDLGHYECYFSSKLDNSQSEFGHRCEFYKKY